MIISDSIIHRDNWNVYHKGQSNEVTSCTDRDNWEAVAYNWVRWAETAQVIILTNLQSMIYILFLF